MLRVFGYNLQIATEAMLQNKLRAVLTSLGIICGVASVIAMMAIGTGAEREILEKMKLLGTNNIIIKPIEKNKKDKNLVKDEDSEKDKNRYTPGLTLKDANNIKKVVPGIYAVSPEIVLENTAIRSGMKRNVKLVGVDPSYFDINKLNLFTGLLFTRNHIENSDPVCVIGYGIKSKLFASENPTGNFIKVGQIWLKIIGVLDERQITKENLKNLGIRDYNFDVYIPLSTMLLRYKNRALITKQSFISNDDDNPNKEEDANQLDRLVVSLKSSELSMPVSEVLNRLLLRRHNQVVDFEIIVPELLLEQERRTKRIFNIVLGAIASISLIVGGIGIMNIMLASILERTKEIGIRKAIGARRHDIMLQFLSEAVSISLTGGIIGIIIGLLMSIGIEQFADIKTIVTPLSIFLSFIVSISVGLIFGIAPANRASKQSPIDLLRHE